MMQHRLDHRPLVAAQRREKMQARLVEAGLLVIAEKGFEATVIDDITAMAGVSRGTFYNHFADVPELMLAARDALVDEWLALTLSAVAAVADPAEACATGLRVALSVTEAYPLLAKFSDRIGINMMRRGNLVSVLLPPILERGMAMGRFGQMPVDLAVDCLSSIVIVALQRQAAGQTFDMAEVIAAILRLLNVSAAEARTLALRPARPAAPAPEGLIARSDAAQRRKLTAG